MVLLHVKRSEQQQFLFETTTQALVKDTILELVNVHNLRQTISKLKLEGGELAQYGPAKHPDKQGIDTYAEDPVEKGENYNMDPTGRRTGNACPSSHAKVLLKTLDEAEELASYKQAQQKVCLTVKMLEDKVVEVKGAIMISYPMGLPQWDPMRQILDNGDEGRAAFGTDDLDPDAVTLWFAGKQLLPENRLSAHIGRNDKTIAIVKLQQKGQGAPAREPAVDQETQKAMMAWYHKRQEQQKRLDENQDDAYLDSEWASGQSLKAHFAGVSSVRLPFK